MLYASYVCNTGITFCTYGLCSGYTMENLYTCQAQLMHKWCRTA